MLNKDAFVTSDVALADGETRHILDGDSESFVELTRAPFPEEERLAARPAAASGSVSTCAGEANPWAGAKVSLLKAAAKHLFQ